MIGYVTVGVSDVVRANIFYGALLAELGGSVMFADDKYTFYGTGWEAPMIAICQPYDGHAAASGNGGMVALKAAERAAVDRVHARALTLGGSDEGAPGIREPIEMNFYGAYFRDPDGNKICVFKMGAE